MGQSDYQVEKLGSDSFEDVVDVGFEVVGVALADVGDAAGVAGCSGCQS